MAGRIVRAAVTALARRGFVVYRHPAVRRQAMFGLHGIDVVFDIGAATGAYGKELRDFGYTGTIVSFEPLTEAFAKLSLACVNDARWHAHHCALGSTSETATINVASNSDSSSLLPLAARHVQAAPQVGYVDTQLVNVKRLDDLATAYVKPASRAYLKLDTQGFEKEVLSGGAETLRLAAGLQLELSFTPLYEGGMVADEAISMAYDAGFHLVGMEPGFADANGQVLQADGVFFRAV